MSLLNLWARRGLFFNHKYGAEVTANWDCRLHLTNSNKNTRVFKVFWENLSCPLQCPYLFFFFWGGGTKTVCKRTLDSVMEMNINGNAKNIWILKSIERIYLIHTHGKGNLPPPLGWCKLCWPRCTEDAAWISCPCTGQSLASAGAFLGGGEGKKGQSGKGGGCWMQLSGHIQPPTPRLCRPNLGHCGLLGFVPAK